MKNKEEFFGKIKDGEMNLNEIGEYLEDEIRNISKHRKNVILDEYIIMPNHIHFIIFLENNDDNGMFHRNISTTENENKIEKFSEEYYRNISPNKNSLGNIIKLFKSFFTKEINQKQQKIFFSWQKNYYDRIIRNEEELQRIRKYIIENPIKWEFDKNNKEGILM